MKLSEKDALIAWLREDLANFETCQVCGMCGATLYEWDDYAADPDGEPSCWPAIGAKEGKGKPCFKYRLRVEDLKAPPRESVPHLLPYQRTISLASGPVRRGVDRYMTPEIEARLKRLSGGDKP